MRLFLNGKVSLDKAKENEIRFFSKNNYFQDFTNNLGIPNLTKRLSYHLLSKIRETLPLVKANVQTLIVQKEEFTKNYQKISELFKSKSYHALIVSLVTQFSNNFQGVFRGGIIKNMKVKDKMFGGAKVNELFDYDFKKSILDINIFEKTKDSDIYWTIKNYTGLKTTMYFNVEAFENFASKQVEELKEPCLLCLMKVQDEVKQIISDVLFCHKEFELFENLRMKIQGTMDDLMSKHYIVTRNMINSLIRIESNSIDQKHIGNALTISDFKKKRDMVIRGELSIDNYKKERREMYKLFKTEETSDSKYL
jgi:dynamin 1-like protein